MRAICVCFCPLLITNPAAIISIPRSFIDCTEPAYPTMAEMRTRVRALPGFEVHELATGHCPMVTAPEALTRLLLGLAGRDKPNSGPPQETT